MFAKDSMQVAIETILAQIEQLPRELVWKLIDYAPGAVFVMRKASRHLKLRVDEYALNKPRHNLCKNVEFEQRDRVFLDVSIAIPSWYANLFELRVILRCAELKKDSLSKCLELVAKYTIRFDLSTVHDYCEKKPAWDGILESMGNELDKIAFKNCNDGQIFATANRLLEGTEFSKVTVISNILSHNAVYTLLPIIRAHTVDHVSLRIKRLEIEEKETFLLRLASIVRSIRINQPKVDGIDRNDRYLFDTYEADWAKIIIEMFKGKLDTLCIYNPFYRRYLTGTKGLRETLPTLGKNLWFSASCSRKLSEVKEYMANEHLVEVDQQLREMTIIHYSREEEKCEF